MMKSVVFNLLSFASQANKHIFKHGFHGGLELLRRFSLVGESLSFASPKESDQRKDDPVAWPGACSRCPALLDLPGRLLNSLRSNRRKRFFQADMRYSAQSDGDNVNSNLASLRSPLALWVECNNQSASRRHHIITSGGIGLECRRLA